MITMRNSRPVKKGRDIKPINEEELKKRLTEDKELQKTNSDVLAELAAKTAELAEKVRGPEGPKERVLKLDDPEDAEPQDIYAALEEQNTETIQPNKKVINPDSTPAIELIRAKLNRLYGDEPDASSEAAEAVASNLKVVLSTSSSCTILQLLVNRLQTYKRSGMNTT
jgi:hypothetical protein